MQHVAISSVLLTSTSTTAALPFQHCYFVQLVLPTASHQEDTNDRKETISSYFLYYVLYIARRSLAAKGVLCHLVGAAMDFYFPSLLYAYGPD